MASTVSLRLSDEVAERLEEIAQDTQRTKTYIIKTALNQYLNDYSDYQVALDRLKDKDKQLSGNFKGLYSYRVGDYRVVYSLHVEVIIVLRIAHRKNVYEE